MEYITLRKQNARNNSLDENIFTSLESTSTSIKNSSLPDLSSCTENEDTKELKSTILNLQTKLRSADREIEVLIEENNTIKKILHDQQNKIDLLTKIQVCPTSSSVRKKVTPSSSQKRRIRANRLLLTDDKDGNDTLTQTPVRNHSPRLIKGKDTGSTSTPIPHSVAKNLRSEDNPESLNNQPKSHDDTNKEKEVRESKINPNNNFKNKKRKSLYIYGGKQCKGIASELANNSTISAKYQINSLIKPFAEANKITDMIDTSTMEGEDIVVLSLGQHDDNPTKLSIELGAILKTLQNLNIRVIVLGIAVSQYLNEHALNQRLKLIVKNFHNCTFIESTKRLPTVVLRQKICNNIYHILRKLENSNEVIRQQDTTPKIVITNYKTIPKTTCSTVMNTSPKSTPQETNTALKKGTIPFHFNAMRNKPNTKPKPDPSSKQFFRE